MKSIVIYQSMSGNTKKIAEAIHKGMSRSGDRCDIARIKDVDAQDLVGYYLARVVPAMIQRGLLILVEMTGSKMARNPTYWRKSR